MGSGLAYSTLGSTHHTIEDLAVATAIPKYDCALPLRSYGDEACNRMVRYKKQGPVYMRIGKRGEKRFHIKFKR